MYNSLIFILMLTLFKSNEQNILNLSESNLKLIDFNIPYTMEKIQIIKKVGPYFPKEFVPSINKALMITEKFIKLHQTLEFMQISEANYIQNTIPVENNQERLSYIAETIKKEFSKDEINKMGSSIGIILTLDKFNKLFQVLNSIISNPDSIQEPANIVKLMEPLIDGKGEKEKKQLKNMTKMLEIIKTLDSPKKSTEKNKPTDK